MRRAKKELEQARINSMWETEQSNYEKEAPSRLAPRRFLPRQQRNRRFCNTGALSLAEALACGSRTNTFTEEPSIYPPPFGGCRY